MLPGKLCIGIVEEDNPLKSYFRMRPLLIEAGGEYQTRDFTEAYAKDGCLRIVPDKNESSHFKVRMRCMGGYCVMDLRAHDGENDKIRLNKNFRGDDTERNAYIVYSDVVREPADGMIFEICDADSVDADGAWTRELPHTKRVLLDGADDLWIVERDDMGAIRARRDGAAPANMQRFEIASEGGTLRFAIRPLSDMESVIAAPEIKRPEPAPAAPRMQPEPAQARDIKVFKPTGEQLFSEQCGLNPRRNRSLQEIIEEKWRHSRVDQLGHPVPANAMGVPLDNPVEIAVRAIRRAWENPAQHEELVNRIADMEAFLMALSARRRDSVQRELQKQLENLEAERLMEIDSLAQLRRQKEGLRETLKAEIRAEEAEALRDATEKTQAAKAELAKYRAMADEAKETARFAEDAFASLSDGRFEDRLRDFALTSRAAKLFSGDDEESASAPAVEPVAPDRGEWIDRVMQAFSDEGLQIDAQGAANLLICAALGDGLILSGAATADKTAAAQAFARALSAQYTGQMRVFTRAADANADFIKDTYLPAVALIADANARPHEDIYMGLRGAAENLIVVAACSDGGFPISAEALERGFMIRIEPVAADAPWRAPCAAQREFAPATLASLRHAFLCEDARVSPDAELKLREIREALNRHGVRLSRHTLNQMYRYCAAMQDGGFADGLRALDLAFAQKALPAVIADARIECLVELKDILAGLSACEKVLAAPLPLLVGGADSQLLPH